MTDPEVERLAELCWRTYSDSPWTWPDDATLAERWRAVARAVLADRAAHTPATDGPPLVEATRERDEARDLYTRAEQQRCDALAIAEANLRRAEAAEAERDALQDAEEAAAIVAELDRLRAAEEGQP